MANIMAVDHTHVVRLETSNAAIYQFGSYKTQDMRQIKNNIFSFSFKNHFNFLLHSNKTTDINSIVETEVSVTDPRHCSTTFYQ